MVQLRGILLVFLKMSTADAFAKGQRGGAVHEGRKQR